jgi:hypothetical protein
VAEIPVEELTLSTVFRVKRVRLHPNDLHTIFLTCYSGSLVAMTLYTNGSEPCPFLEGDFYGTEISQHGDWHLVRLPQTTIDYIRIEEAAIAALSPAEKAKRTKAWHNRVRTISEEIRREKLRHHATDSEEQCESKLFLSQNEAPINCQYVLGHSGSHWNGRGMGDGYTWDDADVL